MSARDATESIEQLLRSLEQLEQSGLKGKEDDLAFLRGMLNTNEFKSLLQAHSAVSESSREPPSPLSPSAVTLANIVSYEAENEVLTSAVSGEEQELCDLLTSPHISALLTAHDKVANKEYPLQSVVTTDTGSPEMNGPIRIVYVEKRKDPLGATVKCNEDKQIVISRVLSGGVASRSGVLHPGDIVHQINDKSVAGWSIDEVASFMQVLSGTVKFKISPAVDEYTAKKRMKKSIHVRSLVKYDVKEDRNHPCQEAGLSLEKGEILRIVEQEDPEWWQAIKEGEGQGVGLIPSKKYMEWIKAYSSTKKKRSRDKTKLYAPYEGELLGKELATYEEMVKVEPQTNRPRPIMLIGPRDAHFNLEDLKQKLVTENSAAFASPIPHTTRQQRSGEEDGKTYHFIQRSQMERDILNGEIIEHAYLGGCYYGTSANSIRYISNSGKTCLLVLDPQTIKLVRTGDLRPFIVYFMPPSAEYMKENWTPKKKDSAILDIVRQATHLEKSYSHYFDHYLPFGDINSAHRDIVSLAENLRSNQQWVPASWLRQ